VAHYRALGFEIVTRNWRSMSASVPGELDVVVRRLDLVVFCEVKARRSPGYGGPAYAVGPSKQARIRSLAAAWLAECGVRDVDVRFDVIAVEGVALTHLESAF
jgi:putative endonuclease